VIAQTQGNPFFLEESVRTLIETGVLVEARGAYRLTQPLDDLQVPATVQTLLAARIDRLPPEDKPLLQTAAVIGTDVPWPLLQAIAGMSEKALSHSLARLQAAEFHYETRLFPERIFTFKHALTHKVANGRQVGEQAQVRLGSRQAVVGFEQGLIALEHVPDSPAATEQAIDVRLGLRTALNVLEEAHGRMLDHLRHAETLAQTLGDQWRLAWVYADMSTMFRVTSDGDRAIAYSQRALPLGAMLGHVGFQVRAHFQVDLVPYDTGYYTRAVESLERNVTTLQGALLSERFGANGSLAASSRA